MQSLRKGTKETSEKEEQVGKKGIVGIKRRRNWDDLELQHI